MQKTVIASHAQLHFGESLLRTTRVSVIYEYLIIFLYTGKPDWMMHLNVESQENYGMVDFERKFFLNPIMSYANYTKLQITF